MKTSFFIAGLVSLAALTGAAEMSVNGRVITVDPASFEQGWRRLVGWDQPRGTDFESGVTLVLKDGRYSFVGLRSTENVTRRPALRFLSFPGYVTIRSESGDPAKCVLADADEKAAGLCILSRGLQLNGITFHGFHAAAGASAVFGTKNLVATDCVFEKCSSGTSAGAVEGGRFVRCRFIGCSAAGEGGAAWVHPGSSFTDSYFENCRAGMNGGALRLEGSSTSFPAITNCTFVSCRAEEGAGGAVYVTADSRGRVPVIGCRFRSCTAPVRAPAERRDGALGWDAFPHSAAIVEKGCEYTDCGYPLRKPSVASGLNRITVRPGDDLTAVRDRIRREGGRAEVIFEDGVYELTNRLELTEHDSKTVWRAKNPGKVIIAGGWTFRGSEAKKLSAADPLAKRLPSEALGRVYAITVPEYLRTNFTPHAFCGGMPVLIGNCGDYTGFEPYRKVIWGSRFPRHPVFSVDTRMMVPARWPNLGEETLYSPGTNGVVRNERFRRWGANDDINVWGFLSSCPYATGRAAVTNLDTAAGIVQIASKEICAKSCIAFFNILEELDAPNEWYFDRASGRLVFYPPEGFSAESVGALGVSADAFFRVRGSDIRIEGFRFTAKHSHPAVILEGGERNEVRNCRFSGLEYEAMYVNGRDCLVRDCVFEELNAAGLRVTGGSAVEGTRGRNIVDNCRFRDFCRMKSSWATGGLILAGGAGNIVRHCEISDSIEHGLDYFGFGHLVEYNRIYDCSYRFQDSAAVYSKGGSVSSGCVFRYNDVSSAPRLVHSIYYDDTTSGHVIYGNIIRGFGGYGIFLGGGRDNLVSNNLVCAGGGVGIRFDERGLFWPSYTGANRTNSVNGIASRWHLRDPGSRVARDFPVFADSFTNGYDRAFAPIGNTYVNNIVLDVGGDFYACQMGKGIKVKEGDYVSKDNTAVRTNGPTGPADRRRPWYLGGVTVLDGSKDSPIDLGFVDIPKLEKLSDRRYRWVKGDFNLRPDAKLREIVPQFEPIPWSEIGPTDDIRSRSSRSRKAPDIPGNLNAH